MTQNNSNELLGVDVVDLGINKKALLLLASE
jgi:hypothetical protein